MWKFAEKHPYVSVLLIVPTVANVAASFVHKAIAPKPSAPSTQTKVPL